MYHSDAEILPWSAPIDIRPVHAGYLLLHAAVCPRLHGGPHIPEKKTILPIDSPSKGGSINEATQKWEYPRLFTMENPNPKWMMKFGVPPWRNGNFHPKWMSHWETTHHRAKVHMRSPKLICNTHGRNPHTVPLVPDCSNILGVSYVSINQFSKFYTIYCDMHTINKHQQDVTKLKHMHAHTYGGS